MKVEEFYQKNKFYPDNSLIVDGVIMCHKCKKNEANILTIGSSYSVSICEPCEKKKEKEDIKLGGWPEFTSESIKSERPKYLKSMIQSHRQGELSREWVENYPKKVNQMVKDGALTREEIKKSKYVWKDLPNYHNLSKTQ